MLIGSFEVKEKNIYKFDSQTPCEISLGSVPPMHFFEELKCAIENPAPAGTTFKLIDQDENVIIKTGKIFPDRQGFNLVTNILITDLTEKMLTGVFEGPIGPAKLFFIKKITRLIQ